MPFPRRAPVPEALTVEVEGRPVTARLRLDPRAKRITLRVDQTRREAVVTAPARRHVGRAERLLAENGLWLSRLLAELPEPMPFRDGATIPLRGEAHRIGIDDGALKPTVAGEAIRLPGPADTLSARMAAWLRAEARRDLGEASQRHAARLGVGYARMRVGDPTRRWGSCSTSGTLSYSWRLILAPPSVLDYVAAHEVAHLREMNHGPAFWAHVADLRPDYREPSDWLKAHGAALHAVGARR